MLDRAAARARCEAATEGPWITDDEHSYHDPAFVYPAVALYTDAICTMHMSSAPNWREDRDFIAHARQDLPAALDELDVKDAEIERLRGALEEIRFVAPCGSWTPEQEALYERALGGES